ncbi:gp19 family putative tail/base plate protein [Tetragenococcus muriaticus 3MR10-3]|uniref:Gp19 family putative tail/base plate protein n=1 Tax=Tetragenococcus muriaticus 3MR10-3 TaxID=1302648 RepID=A0A091C669_9ENTE|nr:gp19 family putative tail/base plate protein [Tetragenococcus muriaticus 3MR10-3]
MGSLKKITNRLYSEWKSSFNHNVEQIERAQKENKTSHKATNKRIDNLVLNSGGDSPNEVTDARTDASGTIHETLKARIDAGENLTTEEIKDLNETLTNQREEISQLNGVIQDLYGGDGSNVDLYVHAGRGNDTTADGTEEKPFKTIQAAVDGIPFLASSRFYIHVAPDVYLEDVHVRDNNITAIEIVATNNEVTNAKEGDTGVFVRSIFFENCQAYCRIRGVTLTDAQNGPGFFTRFDRCSYGAVDNCRAAINTKNLDTNNFRWSDFRCYNLESTMGNIYGTLARNQDFAISSMFASSLRVSNSVSGSRNNVVYSANGAIIFATGADLTGETKIISTYGGQVFGQ